MTTGSRLYEFGGFSLDRDERVLRRGNATVPLTPKATEILLALVDRRGHIVEKTDLMSQVWPDTAVEESNLTQNVYTLRKVLTDEAGKCPFIETVPRRGYRFVGTVREVSAPPSDGVGSESLPGTVGVRPAEEPAAPHDQPPVGAHAGTGDPLLSRPDTPPVTQAGNRRAARQRIGWLVTPLVVVGIGAGIFLVRADRPRPSHRTDELTPRLSRLTHVGTVVRAAISRDGQFLAYANSAGPRESLWVKRIAAADPVQLIEPAVGTYRRGGGLSFAPDGSVYFTWFRPDLAHVGIYRIRQEGGPPEYLRNVLDLPAFDPQGERFACISTTSTIRESRLLVYAAAGDSPPRLVAMRTPPATFLQIPPAWSPDGKRLAVWTLNDETPILRELVVVDAGDGRERLISGQRLHAVDGTVWLPDGSAVIVAARERASSPLRLWQISLAAQSMRPLTTDISDYYLAGLADGGRRIAAVRVDVARSLWVAPLSDPSQAEEVGSDSGELSELETIEWTADGGLLYTSTESGNADVWVYDVARKTRRRLTTNPGDDFTPTSSPDGSIVFASDRSGTLGLWSMSGDGEESLLRQLTSGGDSRPSVARAGGIVFQRGIIQSAPVSLWRLRPQGGDPIQVTDHVSIRPAVSPDGSLVAHYSLTPERWTLAVVPLDGGRPSLSFPLSSTHCGRTVRWSPDGSGLAYIDCDGGVANIWLLPLDGSPPRKLTNFTSGHIATFDWSRDGSRLAWIRRTQVSDVVLIELPAGAPMS